MRSFYCSYSRGHSHVFRDNSQKTHLFDQLTNISSSIQMTCPLPPNLLFLDLISHRLLKLHLLCCSKASNASLSPWGEDLCGWTHSAYGGLGVLRQTELDMLTLNVPYYIIHIILLLEHSPPCIHSFRPLISPAVKEKYFSGME